MENQAKMVQPVPNRGWHEEFTDKINQFYYLSLESY